MRGRLPSDSPLRLALYKGSPTVSIDNGEHFKTRLAYAVAYELGYPLHEVFVSSTSRARDSLYTFDALGRLYAMQSEHFQEQKAPLPDISTYVHLGPIGEAIKESRAGTPSVVLIDEIDKTDPDFANDLLLVLDRMRFEVEELPKGHEKREYNALPDGENRVTRLPVLPLFIVTSNGGKELSDAFLRRCLFHYIE